MDAGGILGRVVAGGREAEAALQEVGDGRGIVQPETGDVQVKLLVGYQRQEALRGGHKLAAEVAAGHFALAARR